MWTELRKADDLWKKKSGFKNIRRSCKRGLPRPHKSGCFWNRILFSTNRPSIRPYETSAGICSPSPKPHLFETAHKSGLFDPVVNWNPIYLLCQLRHRHLKYWAGRRTTTFCLLGYCSLNSSGIIFYLLSSSIKLQCGQIITIKATASRRFPLAFALSFLQTNESLKTSTKMTVTLTNIFSGT